MAAKPHKGSRSTARNQCRQQTRGGKRMLDARQLWLRRFRPAAVAPQVFLEDAGFDWKILGPDVSNEAYVAWQCDQDAYACSGQKCSAQSVLFMHSNWAQAGALLHEPSCNGTVQFSERQMQLRIHTEPRHASSRMHLSTAGSIMRASVSSTLNLLLQGWRGG